MTQVVVLTDANILYSRSLRDIFIYAALEGAVELRWSQRILDEMTRNHAKNRGVSPANGLRLERLMNTALSDAMVEPSDDDYAVFDDIAMPDPDDRHVLASAIAAEADVLCTLNVKDFPSAAMVAAGVELIKPDPLLRRLISRYPAEMGEALRKAAAGYNGATEQSTLDALARAGCAGASQALRVVLDRHWVNAHERGGFLVAGYYRSPRNLR